MKEVLVIVGFFYATGVVVVACGLWFGLRAFGMPLWHMLLAFLWPFGLVSNVIDWFMSDFPHEQAVWSPEAHAEDHAEAMKCCGAKRSSQWERKEREFKEAHPTCCCCGRPTEEIHHVKPFHEHPELELVDSNLRSVCRRCHKLIGHHDLWQSINRHFDEDAAKLLYDIQHRPVVKSAA